MDNIKFAACLNCMDGRVQLPTIHWIKDHDHVDYIDLITEAGMDGILSKEGVNIEGIIQKLNISVDNHGSKIIYIVGHYDCAGNPVDEKEHKRQIRLAAQKLKELKSFCRIIGLWVSNEWLVDKLIEL